MPQDLGDAPISHGQLWTPAGLLQEDSAFTSMLPQGSENLRVLLARAALPREKVGLVSTVFPSRPTNSALLSFTTTMEVEVERWEKPRLCWMFLRMQDM